MPQRLKKIICLCLALVVAGAWGTAAWGREKQILRLADEPWPPYSLGEMGGRAEGGVAVEIAREMYGRLGYTLRIDLFPFRRCLKMAQAGQVEGLLLVLKNPEKRPYLVHTDEVIRAEEAFFYNADRRGLFTWEGPADLKSLVVGLIDGYTYSDNFRKLADRAGFKKEYAADAEANFRKLKAGRIDLYVEDRLVGRRMTEDGRREWRSVRAAEKPIDSYGLCFGISKKSPLADMLPEINRVLAEMKDEGLMKRMIGDSD